MVTKNAVFMRAVAFRKRLYRTIWWEVEKVMPIRTQSDLPAKEILEQENIFVMDESRAMHQDIRPINIVILNLMPGWIEEQERCWSMSGSMYGYDTEVPLVFYGKGAGMQRVNRRVDMTAVAPTLARLAGIREPAASEGGVLEEIAE